MTITQDASAPLIVVVGSTGTQGGSVIKALSESDKPYRIRGLTRDPSKPAAQELTKKGVEVVAVSLTVDNREKVYDAFKGATYVFAVTNFGEHGSKEREISEGKMMVDAAHAANVKLLVWSGLENCAEMSGGKYKNVEWFDGKAEVAEYAKSVGVPFAKVQAGMYMYNFTTASAPKKQKDGSYALEGPGTPDSVLHMIDPSHDYGEFVRIAIEHPDAGSNIFGYGEIISMADMAKQLGEATGKNIPYIQVDDKQYIARLAAIGFPEETGRKFYEMYACCAEFGYFGKNDTSRSRKYLKRPTRTWAEYVKATDWQKLLAL